ncbi:protein SSUH2 homolog isoform X2 [Ptychodera flava]
MKHSLPTPRHVVPSAPPADGNSSQLGNFPSSSQGGGHPPRHQRGYPPISDEPPPYPGPPLSSQIPLEQPPPYPGSPEPSYSQQPWNGDHNAGDDAPPYHWDDDPDIYHISDADEEPPLQPAVPAELDNFQGYENVGLGIGRAIPPPHYQAPSEEHRPPETYGEAAAITKEEARDALLQFVAAHCCYGSRPAKQMVITDILQSSALHYELETFTERRHTNRVYQPYRGELVDGPINGRPPGPWQVDVQPDYLFSNHTKQIEVPHTSTVHGCFHCRSHGFVRCGRCLGRGRVRCAICRGASGRTSWVYDRGRTVPVRE